MACLLACSPVRAVAAPPSTLTVEGSGIVSRDPDRATLAVSIVTNNDAAAAATSANNRLYSALVEHMRAVGVTGAAIKTTGYDLNFVPKPAAGDNYKPPQTGYIVTRGLAITIDNLANVGGVIDAAVAAGVTQVNGVSYGLRDEPGARNAALAAAVEDAAAQAAAIAQAAHVRLGAIRRIDAAQNPAPVFAPRAMALAVKAPAPTQITPSAVEVHAAVTVTYELTP